MFEPSIQPVKARRRLITVSAQSLIGLPHRITSSEWLCQAVEVLPSIPAAQHILSGVTVDYLEVEGWQECIEVRSTYPCDVIVAMRGRIGTLILSRAISGGAGF